MMVAGDEHWRDWAMTALTIASGYWGGGGFIFVPFDIKTSRPAPEFAEIVRAYDPDHVVSLDLPWSTLEAWYPGIIGIDGIDGVDESERLRMIETNQCHTGVIQSETARDEVVTWCSPMRAVPFRDDHSDRQMETVTTLRRRDPGEDRFRRGLAPAPTPTEWARLAASESWRSDLGLFAAMRVGVAQTEAATGSPPEPTVDGLGWLIRPDGDAPTSLIWNANQIATRASSGLERWFLADQRLIEVSTGYLKDRAALVVGDTGTDFALAVAYDRLIGNGIWLTPELLDDGEVFRQEIQIPIWNLLSDLEHAASQMVLTSTSATDAYVEDIALRVMASTFPRGVTAGREQKAVRVGSPVLDGGYLEYAVNEHVGASVPIPVVKQSDGVLEAMAGFESPVPSDLVYPQNSGWVPYWYVDVGFARDTMPRGRDFPSHALVVEDGPVPPVNLRASRESVSFDPHSMGFVATGSFLPGRIGRPRLRSLSMLAWVEAMAEPEGLGVRLSQPGRQTELVRRRLGSRDALLDLMKPENVEMFRAFIPRRKPPTSQERQADQDTVVLGLDPYLTFDAMQKLLAGGVGAATALVDQLSSARLLRRGLILDCVECGRPSFIDADRLGQWYECPQCAAANALLSERWKKKRSEPRWFYDLYAAFRELLAANGDVVLLAASALRAGTGTYMDAPELEFYELASGDRVAEVDVIASVNHDVVLVEAKSNGLFTKGKRGPSTKKLLRIAQVLRADRIVLATTQAKWNESDVAHLEREAAKLTPFAVKVEVKTSLGEAQMSSSPSAAERERSDDAEAKDESSPEA